MHLGEINGEFNADQKKKNWIQIILGEKMSKYTQYEPGQLLIWTNNCNAIAYITK